MVREGVIFDKSAERTPGTSDGAVPEGKSADSDNMPLRAYGLFRLDEQHTQFFQRIPCGLRIHAYGGFTLFANVDASVHHSFMLLPTGKEEQAGEWTIQFPAQTRITLAHGDVYWNLQCYPALRIHDDTDKDAKADVTLLTETVAQRDALARQLRSLNPAPRSNRKPSSKRGTSSDLESVSLLGWKKSKEK